VHMSIRALLVKTFARETSESRGGFAPVPTGIGLPQALEILEQTAPALPIQAQLPATQAAFAVR
jgi:hypothetical protein